MALTWPENPRLIGTKITRLDGLAKASGRAKYPSDTRPEGTLFAVMLYSPHAHAKIKSIDTWAAEKMPGVKAVSTIAAAGTTLRYQGDDIAAVAAETEEQARDAVRAIKVEYEVLPHVVTEHQAMAEGAPEVFKGGNVRKGRAQTKGKPDEAMGKADVVIEGTYSLPVITHVCLEPHGLTARWDGPDKLTVWASTQAVQVVAGELADALGIPVANVTVLTDYMGGGFGSKFGADVWGRTAAELAKKAGRPVKLFLDRVQEHLAAGNRPSASGKIKLGASKDGKLVAMIAETHGTGGARGGSNFPLPYVYEVPASERTHNEVFVNCGGARAMRAPGHPQGCALMEAAMDDLADKLGVDPLEFRLKNLAPGDFHTPIHEGEVKIGAELIGWREKRKPRGQNGGGPVRHGLGMALHQWGGGGTQDKKVSCTINPDGSVELKTATQDIGTGARTILAVIAAEVLGLRPTDIISNIGNSSFPPGQPSGGSTTTPSMAPPCLDAVTRARDAMFKKIAPAVQAAAEELELKNGQLYVEGEPIMGWKEACRKLGMASISETGSAAEGLASVGVGGCQFAEVTVDIETGVVRVKKIVAIQDSGLILDRLTWESQVYGGVIMGLNYGLFEERIMDPETGVMLNPDLELYKLAGASDIPEIVVRAYDPPDQKARGVIGVGEPPTISTAAAIANAVTNAIGVRVPEWPMTPRNVLNALAAASKEGKA
ncbi:MAG: xanthine dehydrogenase family protein molybdopterin-binding subunit [Isosphaeraceae bacterium]|jgi:xanthine dehydrogenase YagR molybdenum-binding subunit